jgi:hypothetical protein
MKISRLHPAQVIQQIARAMLLAAKPQIGSLEWELLVEDRSLDRMIAATSTQRERTLGPSSRA